MLALYVFILNSAHIYWRLRNVSVISWGQFSFVSATNQPIRLINKWRYIWVEFPFTEDWWRLYLLLVDFGYVIYLFCSYYSICVYIVAKVVYDFVLLTFGSWWAQFLVWRFFSCPAVFLCCTDGTDWKIIILIIILIISCCMFWISFHMHFILRFLYFNCI